MLADTALRAKDIDEAAALAAKQRAEEALQGQGAARSPRPRRWRNWPASIAQLKMIERLRKLRG